MKRFLKYIIPAFALFALSCTDSLDEGSMGLYGDGEGCVTITTNLSTTRSLSDDDISTALETSVLKIYDASNNLVRRYEPMSTMPDEIYILAGEYTATLLVGDSTSATFDTSLRSYYGETTMSVVAQQSQCVELDCTLLNHEVSVAFDESVDFCLEEGYSLRVVAADSYSADAYAALGAIKLEYTESGDGYFIIPEDYEAQSLAWEFSGVRVISGVETPVTMQGVLSSVEAQTRSSLTFKYTTYLSFESFTISIDDSVDEFDDSMSFKPQPSIMAVDFDIDELQVGNGDFKLSCSALKSISRVEIVAGSTSVVPLDGGVVVACDDATYSISEGDSTEGEFTIHKSLFKAFGRGGEQSVTIYVTDETGSVGEAQLAVNVSGVTSLYNANYWYNSGDVTVTIVDPELTSVELSYRSLGATDWIDCDVVDNGDNTYSASLTPTWGSSINGASLPIYTLISGVTPDSDLEFLLKTNGEEHGAATLTTGSVEQVIPGAAMTDSYMDCFTEDSEDSETWASGNNSWVSGLCSFGSYGVESCALLTAKESVGNFAAGNIVYGQFVFNGIIAQTGTMSFGQPYEWKARPRTLKLRYAATIGTVSSYTSSYLSAGDTDPARIYMAIVDWSSRRAVTAGSGTPDGTWDPATDSYIDGCGQIIGYGSIYITESTTAFTLSDLEIDIYYYDNTCDAPSGDYTLVISCATSAYGDYMSGSTSNRLWVKDFEFGY